MLLTSKHRKDILQTRYVTALDVWMGVCVLFLVLAIFEYSLLLGIRFGKQSKINADNKGDKNLKADKLCLKIDRYALRIFVPLQILTIGTYFYHYYTVSKMDNVKI